MESTHLAVAARGYKYAQNVGCGLGPCGTHARGLDAEKPLLQIRAAESESARRIDPGALAVQSPNVTPVCTSPWRDCEQREPFRARTTSACSPVRAKAGGD